MDPRTWNAVIRKLKQASNTDPAGTATASTAATSAVSSSVVDLDGRSCHAADLPDAQASEDLAALATHLMSEQKRHSAGSASEAGSAFCRILMRTLAKRQVDFSDDAVATISFALRHWADWRSAACTPQLQHEALTTLAAFVPLCISKMAPAEAAAQLALLQATAQGALPPHNSSSSPQALERQGSASSAGTALESRRLALKCLGDLGSRQPSSGSSSSSSKLPALCSSSLGCVVGILAESTAGAGRPVEDLQHSRLYASLLRTLNQLLVESKKAWTPHTAVLLEGLQRFTLYGVPPAADPPAAAPDAPCTSSSSGAAAAAAATVSTAGRSRPSKPAYLPPHRRRNPAGGHNTSDSDASDSGQESSSSNASSRRDDRDRFKSSNVRVAMLACLQSLAKSDPKALHPHWLSILPVQQPLQPHPLTPHLFTMLLHDPIPKVRSMAAATLTALLEGPAQRTYLSVAEARTASRPSVRALTALSTTLGQMVVALHQGLLAAVAQEPLLPVLAVVLRALCAILAAAPYDRLPQSLLPDLVTAVMRRWAAVRALEAPRVEEVAAVHTAVLACLAEALNTSSGPNAGLQLHLQAPASSEGSRSGAAPAAALIAVLLDSASRLHAPLVRIEALAALKGAATQYPFTMQGTWQVVKDLLLANIAATSPATRRSAPLPAGARAEVMGSASTNPEDKAAQHAVKLLSSYLLHCASLPRAGACDRSTRHWGEATALLIPAATAHPSYMVRSAALAVFADLSSETLLDLPPALLCHILATLCSAAVEDPAPAARAAACKSLGSCCCQVACLQAVCQPPSLQPPPGPQGTSSAPRGSGPGSGSAAGSMEVMERCTAAIGSAVSDVVLSVRVSGAWALANLCDTLRMRGGGSDAAAADATAASGRFGSAPVQLEAAACQRAAACTWQRCGGALAAAALAASQDVDKVRANGIRALGNLLASLDPGGPLEAAASGGLELAAWLPTALQVLQSSMTTGNMKVQWNACYAVGLLQSNKRLLRHPAAASRQGALLLALVLLVRDSANYKIRIHAAAALCALDNRQQYGDMFVDALTVTCSILEWAETGSSAAAPHPAALNGGGGGGEGVGLAASSGMEDDGKLHNYRYIHSLEEQMRSTVLHLLALLQPADFSALRELAARKAGTLAALLQRCASAHLQDAPATSDMSSSLPTDPFGLQSGGAASCTASSWPAAGGGDAPACSADPGAPVSGELGAITLGDPSTDQLQPVRQVQAALLAVTRMLQGQPPPAAAAAHEHVARLQQLSAMLQRMLVA